MKSTRIARGGKRTTGHFEKYYLDTGISHESTFREPPNKVWVSEHGGRTQGIMVRCLRKDGGFPKFLWGEVFFNAAGDIINDAPHAGSGNVINATPCEIPGTLRQG